MGDDFKNNVTGEFVFLKSMHDSSSSFRLLNSTPFSLILIILGRSFSLYQRGNEMSVKSLNVIMT